MLVPLINTKLAGVHVVIIFISPDYLSSPLNCALDCQSGCWNPRPASQSFVAMFVVTITMIMVNDYDKNNDNDKSDCQPISWSVVNMFAMKRIMTIVNPAAGIKDPPLNLLLPRSQKCNPCLVSTNLLSQSVAANSNFFQSLQSYISAGIC